MQNKISQKVFSKLGSVLLASAIFGLFFYLTQSPGYSQDSSDLDWSYPVRVPQHDNSSQPPRLVSDLNNTVHSFTVDLSRGSAIAYRQWTEDIGWSIPVDIILPPKSGSAIIFGAEIDNNDVMHLVAYYGQEGDANIYHFQAPVYFAQTASAWSEPQLIAADGGPIADGHFVSDGGDNLYVVYEGDGDGLGLYEVHSEDGGVSWSEPAAVYLSSGNEFLPAAVETHLDEAGNLHVVWSIWSATLGAGVELFYSQKTKGSQTWTRPFLIADRGEGDYESDWAAITSTGDELIVLYQDSNPATKFMRKSRDNGQTWTDPERPWPHIGEYENAIFLKDSANNLHVVLGNRNGDCCHGMWHGRYENGSWQNLESVIQGPKTIDFDPSKPSAVMGQGNLIFIVWWMDTSARNGAWYSYAYLDDVEPLPQKAIQIPISNTQTELAAADEDIAISAEATRPVILDPSLTAPDEGLPSSTAITIGIAISLAGILLAMLVWYFFYKLR
ncbi:MAG: sialidase family protein [Anaerolineae bacterium]